MKKITKKEIEQQKRSALGRELVAGRWKNATDDDRKKQVKAMVDGKKKFWAKWTPKQRSNYMKKIRAHSKVAPKKEISNAR